MKTLLIFLSYLSVYSQKLCGFITNTIEDIENLPYSKVKFLDKAELLNKRIRSVIDYDNFGRLIAIDNRLSSF